jgi:HK97 family phage portal protein
MTILARLLEPAEKRSTLAAPADWLIDSLTGGAATVSGENVSPARAMGLSAYFDAIRIISEDCGKLPLPLYDRQPDGGKNRLPKHPIYRLIHDQPNPEMSAQAFRETLTQHALGWGGGFAEIERRGDGFPVALWPLDPAIVTVERDRDTKRLDYVIRGPDRGVHHLRPENVFHLHGLGFDGVTGYSVARLAKQSIGLALASEKSGAAFFGNDARPGGVLQTPNALDPEAKTKLREQWNAAHRGSQHAYKMVVLEDGMTFNPITIPSKDAQWVESRMFSVEEIARWFRVPPHKLQHLLRATFSNIAEQSIEYVVDCLLAWLKRWESEIWRKLIPRSDQARIFAEHVVEGLLRGDVVARFDAYQKAIQTGWMSRNEARVLENMNPAEGLDAFLEPMNMATVGAPGLQGDAGDKGDEGDRGERGPSGVQGDLGPAGRRGSQGDSGAVGERGERGLPGERVALVLEDRVENQKPTLIQIYHRLLSFETDKAAEALRRGNLKEWAGDFYKHRADTVRKEALVRVQEFALGLWQTLLGNVDASQPLIRLVESHVADAAAEHVRRSVADLTGLKTRTHESPFKTWKQERPEQCATALLQRLGKDIVALAKRRPASEEDGE